MNNRLNLRLAGVVLSMLISIALTGCDSDANEDAKLYIKQPTSDHADLLQRTATYNLGLVRDEKDPLSHSFDADLTRTAYEQRDGYMLRWLDGDLHLDADWVIQKIADDHEPTDNASFDQALARILLTRTNNAHLAYRYLATAALRDSRFAPEVRALLVHYGCLKADDTWKAIANMTESVGLSGADYPTVTHPSDLSNRARARARLKLERDHVPPKLGADCPILELNTFGKRWTDQ